MPRACVTPPSSLALAKVHKYSVPRKWNEERKILSIIITYLYAYCELGTWIEECGSGYICLLCTFVMCIFVVRNKMSMCVRIIKPKQAQVGCVLYSLKRFFPKQPQSFPDSMCINRQQKIYAEKTLRKADEKRQPPNVYIFVKSTAQ